MVTGLGCLCLNNLESFPALHCRATILFVLIKSTDITHGLGFLARNITPRPPRAREREQCLIVGRIDHLLPFNFCIMRRLNRLDVLLFELRDRVDDKVNLTLQDGRPVRERGGRCKN